MLEHTEQIDTGNGKIDVNSSWSPYSPVAPLQALKKKLELNIPAKDQWEDWLFKKLYGIGESVSYDKYLKMDHELLGEKLNAAFIDKDELTFLQWLYQLTSGKGKSNEQIVFQMPEDILRSFSDNVIGGTSSFLDQFSNKIILKSIVNIQPIHVCNEIENDEDVKDERYTSTPIYSLKALAMWMLGVMSVIRNGELISDKEEIKVSLFDVSLIYEKIYPIYWHFDVRFPLDDLAAFTAIGPTTFGGYLDGGRKFELKVYHAELDDFLNSIEKAGLILHNHEHMKYFVKQD